MSEFVSGVDLASFPEPFAGLYRSHLQHLRHLQLKGLRPKTVEAYAQAIWAAAGLADGLQNFTINSFHVLLSALWSQHDPEQVEIKSWSVRGRQFRAFIGDVGTRSSSGAKLSLPVEWIPKLASAVQSEPLDQDLHWFVIYVANINGEFSFAALKDNEPWPASLTTLASCGWGPCGSFSVQRQRGNGSYCRVFRFDKAFASRDAARVFAVTQGWLQSSMPHPPAC